MNLISGRGGRGRGDKKSAALLSLEDSQNADTAQRGKESLSKVYARKAPYKIWGTDSAIKHPDHTSNEGRNNGNDHADDSSNAGEFQQSKEQSASPHGSLQPQPYTHHNAEHIIKSSTGEITRTIPRQAVEKNDQSNEHNNEDIELAPSTSSDNAVMAMFDSKSFEISPQKNAINPPISQHANYPQNPSHNNRGELDEDALSAWWFLTSNSESFDSVSINGDIYKYNITSQGLDLPNGRYNTEMQQKWPQPYMSDQVSRMPAQSGGSGVLKLRTSHVPTSCDLPIRNAMGPDSPQSVHFQDSSGTQSRTSLAPSHARESKGHNISMCELPQWNELNQEKTAISSVTPSFPSVGPSSSLPQGHSTSSSPRMNVSPILKYPKYSQMQSVTGNDNNQTPPLPFSPPEQNQQQQQAHLTTKSKSGGNYISKEQKLRKKWLSRNSLGGTVKYDQDVPNEYSGESSTVASYHYVPPRHPFITVNEPTPNIDWDPTVVATRPSKKAPVEWTREDSSYGAAFQAFGWVPKHIRKMIEIIFLVLLMTLLIYVVVKTGIKLNAGGGRSSKSSGTGGEESAYWEDDDHYLANKNYDDDTTQNDDRNGDDGKYNNGPDRIRRL